MIQHNLPLVELHRHLDGNIRNQTIWDLAQQHHLELPAKSFAELSQYTQITDRTSDLLAFLAKLDCGVSVLADLDACRRIAYENVEDAFKEGIDYIELRFSPFYMAQAHQLPLQDVVAAVIDGTRSGMQDFPVRVNLIGILSRTFGAPTCHLELDALLAFKDEIAALDLAGDELGYPAPMFVEHFTQARDAGWAITVHAGEAAGPESIWDAIKLLGASRIGHGVAAMHDPKLMEYMAKYQIGIESCPTSNYQTATVADTAHHPMKLFLQHGIEVTLSTDDPGVSAINLAHEYDVAKNVIGLNQEQLAQLQRNAVSQAFLSDDDKITLFETAAVR